MITQLPRAPLTTAAQRKVASGGREEQRKETAMLRGAQSPRPAATRRGLRRASSPLRSLRLHSERAGARPGEGLLPLGGPTNASSAAPEHRGGSRACRGLARGAGHPAVPQRLRSLLMPAAGGGTLRRLPRPSRAEAHARPRLPAYRLWPLQPHRPAGAPRRTYDGRPRPRTRRPRPDDFITTHQLGAASPGCRSAEGGANSPAW